MLKMGTTLSSKINNQLAGHNLAKLADSVLIIKEYYDLVLTALKILN